MKYFSIFLFLWICNGHCRAQYSYITQLGTTNVTGTGNNQFNAPAGVGIGASGNIYVADKNNERMMKFDSDGNFLLKWGSLGSGISQFGSNGLEDIAFDSDGNVWVADRSNDRIMKFDNGGNPSNIGATGQNWIGTVGSGVTNFQDPNGLAINSGDTIYVADRTNERVQVLRTDGTFLFSFGSSGAGNGQFEENGGSSDIAFTSDDKVLVVDRDNDRIQLFEKDGTFIETYGTLGSGNSNFDTPEGVTVHPNGDIWVADRNNERIVILNYSPDDTPRMTYKDQFGSSGLANGQFSSNGGAVDIAFDAAGDAWVVDRNNDRVQKFDGPDAPVTAPISAVVAATIFLEGAYKGPNMNTLLKSQSLIPTAAPYNGVYGHSGSESVANQDNIPATAVDWVLVQLRESTNGATAGSAAGFLLSDGSIKATDGTSDLTVSLSGNSGATFFLVVYHRNHLPIMSATAIAESGGTYSINFGTSQSQAFGSNPMIQLATGVFGMIAGDADGDGTVDDTDLTTWRGSNGQSFSYLGNGRTDINLDGTINAVDRNNFQQPNSGKTSQVPTN